MNAEGKKHRVDLVVVTAFGRHNWLVRELSNAEWRIAVLDVGPLLGQWGSRDLVNPFGLSPTEELTPGQLQYYTTQYNSHQVENGVVLRYPGGPIEGQGPLTEFQMGRSGVTESIRQYFSFIHFHDWRKKARATKFVSDLKFDDGWLVHLANQMCSTRYYANSEAMQNEESIAFFSQLWRDGFTGDKNNIANALSQYSGVDVYYPTALNSFLKKGGSGFDTGYQVGASLNSLSSRMVLWGLSSAETQFISKECLEGIYNSVVIEPSWSWQAFDLKLEPKETWANWPEQFYFCNQLRLSWTHENLGLVSRVGDGQFTVHLRIPKIFRFNKEYLEKTLENLKAVFLRDFPNLKITGGGLPVEATALPQKLGPPRLPVYDAGEVAKLKVYKNEHFFLDTFENIKTHQFQAQLVRQGLLLEHFSELRKKWLGVEARIEQRKIQREIRRGKEL